jgi:hypothetical protein
MSDHRAEDSSTPEHVPAGTYAARPDLERLLIELREPPALPRSPLTRWQLVRRRVENVLYQLERTGKILARDPELTAELPPGVGGCTHWEAVTDGLDRVAKELAGLLPCSVHAAALASIRAAIVPQRGQPKRLWNRQARIRAQLTTKAVAILQGLPCELAGVSGCESLTLDALGIAGVPNPDRVPCSKPEAYFRPLRGTIGGPFDRSRKLHWLAVAWNAARVPPESSDYPDAVATEREALLALAYLERGQGPIPYGVLATLPGGPLPETGQ